MRKKEKEEKKTKINCNSNISDSEIKIIVDLISRGNSINDVADHLKYVYNIKIANSTIRQIIIVLGKKAHKFNKTYDKLIKDKIEIIETDEIHQGRNGIAISYVDKKSTYLLSIKKINDKLVDTISSYLNETPSANKNLLVIITDGLSSYKDAVKRMSEKVTHIMCHGHAYRAVMKELESYIRVRNKKYKRVKDAREKVEFIQKQIRTHKKSLS